jgi:hypothetical protein
MLMCVLHYRRIILLIIHRPVRPNGIANELLKEFLFTIEILAAMYDNIWKKKMQRSLDLPDAYRCMALRCGSIEVLIKVIYYKIFIRIKN